MYSVRLVSQFYETKHLLWLILWSDYRLIFAIISAKFSLVCLVVHYADTMSSVNANYHWRFESKITFDIGLTS